MGKKYYLEPHTEPVFTPLRDPGHLCRIAFLVGTPRSKLLFIGTPHPICQKLLFSHYLLVPSLKMINTNTSNRYPEPLVETNQYSVCVLVYPTIDYFQTGGQQINAKATNSVICGILCKINIAQFFHSPVRAE